jgi:hypothetical protein
MDGLKTNIGDPREDNRTRKQRPPPTTQHTTLTHTIQKYKTDMEKESFEVGHGGKELVRNRARERV